MPLNSVDVGIPEPAGSGRKLAKTIAYCAYTGNSYKACFKALSPEATSLAFVATLEPLGHLLSHCGNS